MPIAEKANGFVDPNAASISLAQILTVTAGATNPTYLILTALDRNEYTAGATTATGSLSGNGHTLGLTSIGGDARSAGIVFTYQASTGRYYNSNYGYLDQLTYDTSASAGDVTSLSLFGTDNLSVATADAGSTYALIQADAAGYIGSATVVTRPGFTTPVPAQATPDSIAAVADSFVGQAWNMDGCWILASTITAEAGASLPVQSTLIDLPGQANGEWIVAFNGPAGQTGNWQSMVTAGEIVVIGTAGGGGHITTCVSGSGSTAMLVDNITYVNGSGQIQNLANDESSSDIIVAAPHLASQEWAGVAATSVVIYELDTPIVVDTIASDSVACLASISLAPLFAATDPASKSITQWQIYDTAGSDTLVLNGMDNADHTAASALTTASLAAVSLLAGATATTDTLDVRAYNGSYWGDWTTLSVSVTGVVAEPPPALMAATANQTWLGGKPIGLTLSASTFSDPGAEMLTYTATLSNGQALPSWLSFNAVTGTLTGSAPATAQSLTIVVTATNSAGASASDTFGATVIGAPTLTEASPNQTWTEGRAVSLALPANTFADPQAEKISYTAALSNGQALPSWLTFNATTQTFSGTAPATAQTIGITVTATDSSDMTAVDSFSASVQPVIVAKPAITITAQTANQTWTDGQTADLVLPSTAFTDALGLKMTFAAYEVSGPNVSSWLHFNPETDTLSGTVPSTLSGTLQLEIVATDAQHAIAADLFSVTFASAPAHLASWIAGASPGAAANIIPSTAGVVMAFPT